MLACLCREHTPLSPKCSAPTYPVQCSADGRGDKKIPLFFGHVSLSPTKGRHPTRTQQARRNMKHLVGAEVIVVRALEGLIGAVELVQQRVAGCVLGALRLHSGEVAHQDRPERE
jgi:hypothetical protein